MKTAADRDHHGEWKTCSRCSSPGMVSRTAATGALAQMGAEFFTCWNGRDCSLRMRRARNNAVALDANRAAAQAVDRRDGT